MKIENVPEARQPTATSPAQLSAWTLAMSKDREIGPFSPQNWRNFSCNPGQRASPLCPDDDTRLHFWGFDTPRRKSSPDRLDVETGSRNLNNVWTKPHKFLTFQEEEEKSSSRSIVAMQAKLGKFQSSTLFLIQRMCARAQRRAVILTPGKLCVDGLPNHAAHIRFLSMLYFFSSLGNLRQASDLPEKLNAD